MGRFLRTFFIGFTILMAFTKSGYSQLLIPTKGTVYLYDFIRIDSITKEVMSSFRLIKIDTSIYSGANFPFLCLKCEFSVEDDVNNCNSRESAIDNKNICKVEKKIGRGVFNKLNKDGESTLPKAFNQCLILKYGDNFYLRKHALLNTDYSIVDCKEIRGVGEGIFCEETFVKDKVPIIYKIEKVK